MILEVNATERFDLAGNREPRNAAACRFGVPRLERCPTGTVSSPRCGRTIGDDQNYFHKASIAPGLRDG